MWDITILAVGRLKEKYWQTASEEYLKRLKPYARVRVEELAAEPFSKATREKAKKIEAGRIENYLKKRPDSLIMLLAESGRRLDSFIFAETLKNINQPLILVIGGALGFKQELFEAYPKISLSKLTFPHELARVILLEQLYRATAILNNRTYHY